MFKDIRVTLVLHVSVLLESLTTLFKFWAAGQANPTAAIFASNVLNSQVLPPQLALSLWLTRPLNLQTFFINLSLFAANTHPTGILHFKFTVKLFVHQSVKIIVSTIHQCQYSSNVPYPRIKITPCISDSRLQIGQHCCIPCDLYIYRSN